MQTEQRYWFPAKRYGWGWGIPSTWQGWVVLAIYAGLLTFGIFRFRPEPDLGPFIVYVAVCSALLVVICWLKGEPPKWRWGKK